MLQLFAGTLRFDDAIARSVIATTGDPSLVARLAPYLPEAATITATGEGPATAS